MTMAATLHGVLLATAAPATAQSPGGRVAPCSLAAATAAGDCGAL